MKHIKNYKFSILLFAILASIVYISSSRYPSYIVLARMILSIILVLIHFVFTSSIKYKGVRLLLLASFLIIISFDLTYAAIYQITPNLDVIASILDTDFSEALSFLKALKFYILLIIPFAALYFLSYKEIKMQIAFSFKKSLVCYVAYFFMLFCMVEAYLFIGDYKVSKNLGQSLKNRIVHIPHKTAVEMGTYYRIVTPLFFYDLFFLKEYYNEYKHRKSFYTIPKQKPNHIIDSLEGVSNTIILILGESASSFHYGVYGYQKNTTPFLESLKTETNNVSLYEGIATYLYTKDCIPVMLTPMTDKQNKEKMFNYKNILHLAQDKGYKTYWISNQNNLGMFEGDISLLSYSSDYKYFMPNKNRREDFDLISIFEKIYNAEDKQFIVLHLIGSHSSFSDKYDQIDAKVLGDKTVVDQYDCSIHHTDRFIQKVYEVLDEESSYNMFITSDHAENPNSIKGRLTTDGYSHFVPFINISNKEKALQDSIISNYVSPSGYINNANLYYILASSFGYSVQANFIKDVVLKTDSVAYLNSVKKSVQDLGILKKQ